MAVTVRVKKWIRVEPAQVYFAFTHATALRQWLCDYATAVARPAGRLYLWWHGDFYSAGEFVRLEANQAITFTWFGRGEPAPSQVKVTFKPMEAGTQVALAHTVPDSKKWQLLAQGFRHEWAASLENLASVLETGLDKRVSDRPMLGVSLSDFNAEIAKTLHIPVSEGLRLDGLLPEMGASQAGLQANDVLVAMNGKPLTNDFGSLVVALQGKKGGEQVEVVFYRGSEKRTVSMQLSKRAAPQIPWDPKELAIQLRSKFDEGLVELEKVFAGVSQDEAEFHPARVEWSAKEVLAHLIQSDRLWLEDLDDLIGGNERVADDFSGNIPSHMTAIVSTYPSTRALLDELRRLSNESVAMAGSLPPEFVARKGSYYQAAASMLEGFLPHTLAHIDQIKAAIAAAPKQG